LAFQRLQIILWLRTPTLIFKVSGLMDPSQGGLEDFVLPLQVFKDFFAKVSHLVLRSKMNAFLYVCQGQFSLIKQ
jgi:hypothetical protein